MITEGMVIKAGRTFKPHGYKGALKAESEFGGELLRTPGTPVFFKIDNILVPFFVEELKEGASGGIFLKLEDLDSDADATEVANKDFYVLRSLLSSHLDLPEDVLDTLDNDMKGYRVTDVGSSELLGIVEEISEGVEYDYLLVKREDGSEINIPIVDEFIFEIEDASGDFPGEIKVGLPDGFLDI